MSDVKRRVSVAELRSLYDVKVDVVEKQKMKEKIRMVEEFPHIVETEQHAESKIDEHDEIDERTGGDVEEHVTPTREETKKEDQSQQQQTQEHQDHPKFLEKNDNATSFDTGRDDDDRSDVQFLSLQSETFSAEREEYEVIFDGDSNEGLGMVVQQQDETMANGEVRERLVVEMVTESGLAARHGVTEGSTLIHVGGVDVSNKSYQEALTLLKAAKRPLTLRFQKGLGEYTTQGYCLKSSGSSFAAPKRYSSWKLRYFVLGGPVAARNVLQLYKSKSDFDKVVISVVSRKPVTVKFKAYMITNEYQVTELKETTYQSQPSAVVYFGIRRPNSRFKHAMHIARLPGDSSDNISKLQEETETLIST